MIVLHGLNNSDVICLDLSCEMLYLPFLVVTSVLNLSLSGKAQDKLKDALTPSEELPLKRTRRKTTY